ncbi:hypothetical protein GEMRC1_013164 [Eukaryota sp. GEM-RC1]
MEFVMMKVSVIVSVMTIEDFGVERCIFCISGYSGSECKVADVQPESPLLMYIVLALCCLLLGAIGQYIYFSVKSSNSYNSDTLNLSELKHPLLQESEGPL